MILEKNNKKDTYRILVINTGSTSTKIGIFDNDNCISNIVIRHERKELERFGGPDVYLQKNYRKQFVLEALKSNNILLSSLDAISGSAGRLPCRMNSGTYAINENLMQIIPNPLIHAVLLGMIIAQEIGEQLKIPSYIVDPTTVDELLDIARITGFPEIGRETTFHTLNHKAVARRYAKEIYKEYNSCRIIVAHMGGGISIGAHLNGKVIDVNNASFGEGPFSPERGGSIPGVPLVRICYSGQFTQEELESKFFNSGGAFAHLGTSDIRRIESMAEFGDVKAEIILEAMAYNISKEIGSMYAVLESNVDGIILTGGLAHSDKFVQRILKRISNMGPVKIYPGEDELIALAQGALRVLQGEEEPIIFQNTKIYDKAYS